MPCGAQLLAAPGQPGRRGWDGLLRCCHPFTEELRLPTCAVESRLADVAPSTTRRCRLLALAAIFAAVYLGAMFSPPLLDDADATHAEAAREMFATGDYVTLRVNGIRYLEKAPLPYWLAAISYRVFGVDEFATRLPDAVAVLLLAWLAWSWGKRAFGERAGDYGSLFVLTSAGVFLFTRIFIPDVVLSLFIAASLYWFLTALQDAEPWRWYAAYACAALAVLTKGLVALIFIGASAVLYLAITGEWRRWREFQIVGGAAVLLAIAAPWHILAAVRNQHFLWFYFVNEHLLRFLGRRYPRDYNKLPAALYWGLHLVWLFPWSFYFHAAVRLLWRERGRWRSAMDFRARSRLLCWILAGMVLLFFSLSTNQEYYTFPAYLPLLLLIADGVTQAELDPGGRRILTFGTATLALVSLAAGMILVAGLWRSRHLPFTPDIAAVLAKHDMAADTLSMSHALDLSSESFSALRLPAALAALALLVAPAGAFFLQLRRKPASARWALGAGMAVVLVAAHIAFGRFGNYLSSARLAGEIATRSQASDRVMIYGDQAFGSSLLFYLRRPVELVNGRTTSMWFGSTYPDAPKIFLDDASLMRQWTASERIFLFVTAEQKKTVEKLLPRHYVVAELSGKTIYSNQP